MHQVLSCTPELEKNFPSQWKPFKVMIITHTAEVWLTLSLLHVYGSEDNDICQLVTEAQWKAKSLHNEYVRR